MKLSVFLSTLLFVAYGMAQTNSAAQNYTFCDPRNSSKTIQIKIENGSMTTTTAVKEKSDTPTKQSILVASAISDVDLILYRGALGTEYTSGSSYKLKYGTASILNAPSGGKHFVFVSEIGLGVLGTTESCR